MPTPRPHRQTPTTLARPRVTPPRPRIPWDRLLELSRPVALHPTSRARPTTCVGIPGLARPTALTEFTIAWCLLPERHTDPTNRREPAAAGKLRKRRGSCFPSLLSLFAPVKVFA